MPLSGIILYMEFHWVLKSHDPVGKKWKFRKTIAFGNAINCYYFVIPCSFLWDASSSSAFSEKWFKALQRCQQLEQKEARRSENLFSKRMGKQKSLCISFITTTTVSLSYVNCENGDLQNMGNKRKYFYCLYYILDFGTVWMSTEGRKHVCW